MTAELLVGFKTLTRMAVFSSDSRVASMSGGICPSALFNINLILVVSVCCCHVCV